MLLFGYGYSTNFFVKDEATGRYASNEKFSWRFYAPTIAKNPLPFSIASPKPKGVFRIFILGSSAAWGTPSPSFSFSRILSVMLCERYPDVKFEVVNTAIMGVNSHIVLPIARDCADFEPDMFIVYLGNNEVIGLHGPKTHGGGAMPGMAFIRASLWIKSTRCGQLIGSLLGGSGRNSAPSKPQDLEYFRKHLTAADDPDRLAVYENFSVNLKDIISVGLDSGARVLLATVAVNLQDSPPFGSLHRQDLGSADLKRWEALYADGIAAETSEQHSNALEKYLAALDIDDRFADLHFRLGRCYRTLGQIDAARKHYLLARDLDAMAARADHRINETIRKAVSFKPTQGVELADVEQAMGRSGLCEPGIPGRKLFYEHVHMKFAGNYQVAKTLLPGVARAVERKHPKSGSLETKTPTIERCANSLGLSQWRRGEMLTKIVELTSMAPFTGQIDHKKRQRNAEKELESLRAELGPDDVEDAIVLYRKAIEQSPNDWSLHFDIASLYDTLKRYESSMYHLKTVLRTVPRYAPARLGLAHALANTGKNTEALAEYRLVLDAGMQDASVHAGIGVVLARLKRFDEAIDHFEQALQMTPGDKAIAADLERVRRLKDQAP